MYKSYIIVLLLFFTYNFANAEENKYILFNSDKSGFSDIYSVNLNNIGEIKNLTNSKNYDFWARWSENSKKILYCSMANTSDGFTKSKIWIMDETGENKIKLTKGDYDDFFPNWSPDGKKIIFQSYRDGNGEIYIMDADGTNVKRLTNSDYEDSYPSFSPDGSQIIFQSKKPNKIKIMLMNINKKDIQPIFNDDDIENISGGASASKHLPNSRKPERIAGGNNEYAPIFSSDGQKIYFVIDNYNTASQIFEYDLKNDVLIKIPSPDDKKRITEDYTYISNNNKLILTSAILDSDDMKKRKAYIFDIENNTKKRILENFEFNVFFPSWFKN